jgi:hypothetical protein
MADFLSEGLVPEVFYFEKLNQMLCGQNSRPLTIRAAPCERDSMLDKQSA